MSGRTLFALIVLFRVVGGAVVCVAGAWLVSLGHWGGWLVIIIGALSMRANGTLKTRGHLT